MFVVGSFAVMFVFAAFGVMLVLALLLGSSWGWRIDITYQDLVGHYLTAAPSLSALPQLGMQRPVYDLPVLFSWPTLLWARLPTVRLSRTSGRRRAALSSVSQTPQGKLTVSFKLGACTVPPSHA